MDWRHFAREVLRQIFQMRVVHDERKLDSVARPHAGHLRRVGEHIKVGVVVGRLVFRHELRANDEADFVGVIHVALSGIDIGMGLREQRLVLVAVQAAVEMEHGLVAPPHGHVFHDVVEIQAPIVELVGIRADEQLNAFGRAFLESPHGLARNVIAIARGTEDERDVLDVFIEELVAEHVHDFFGALLAHFGHIRAAHHMHEVFGIGRGIFGGVVDLDWARFANDLMEKALRRRGHHEKPRAARTCRLAEQRDV